MCEASELESRDLAKRLGEAVSGLDIERWRQGEGEFPAWVISAVDDLSDVAGAKARAARALDDICEASNLPTISLVAALRSSTGVPISAIDIERWRQGDADFPAWVVSAIADVAGMEGDEAGWVTEKPEPVAEAELPTAGRSGIGRKLVALGAVTGLLLLGGAYGGYRLTHANLPQPTAATSGGGEEQITAAPTATPPATAPAATSSSSSSQQPSASPSPSPNGSGAPQTAGAPGVASTSGSSNPAKPVPSGPAAAQTHAQVSGPPPPPPATPRPSSSPTPSSGGGGVVSGLINTLGGGLGSVLGLLGL